MLLLRLLRHHVDKGSDGPSAHGLLDATLFKFCQSVPIEASQGLINEVQGGVEVFDVETNELFLKAAGDEGTS